MRSTATANPVLTGHARKFMQDRSAFIGMRLFPVFMAGEQSAQYYVFDEANLLAYPRNIQRAPGAAYTRSLMKLSDDSFTCREYGHEEPVDDRERKKYANAIDADTAAVERATSVLLLNHEVRVMTKATSASVPSTTIVEEWNDYANSDPVKDVDAAKKAIHLATGMDANVIALNRDVFYALKEHPKILDKIKYSQRGVVTREIIAEVFGVEELLIAGSIENSAAEGQAISPAYIWGDKVIVAHRETSQNLMAPNFGRTFAWVGETGPDGVLVESYRQDEIRSDVHRARHDVDEKLVAPKAAYVLKDALT